MSDYELIVRSGLFDSDYYRLRYKDIAEAGVDPLSHFLSHGARERRDPHPLFWTSWYVERRPDVVAAGINPLAHFIRYGEAEGARPNPLFAPDWYRKRHLEGAGADESPLRHYCKMGAGMDFDPHPLFDARWYRETCGDLIADCETPLAHYLWKGEKRGMRPNAAFCPSYYQATTTESWDALCALEHFERFGQPRLSRPSPNANLSLYLDQLPSQERREVRDRALEHYLRTGRSRGLSIDFRHGRTRAAALVKPPLPLVLLVTHSQGGGVERHIADLIGLQEGLTRFASLRFGIDGWVVLVEREPGGQPVEFRLPGDFDALVDALKRLLIDMVHIHHTHGAELHVEQLVGRLGIPFMFTVHDYFWLSPEPHLADLTGRFVGDPIEDHEPALLAASQTEVEPVSLALWQQRWRWLLEDAERVIAPSWDVARRVSHCHPCARVMVLPHPELGRSRRTAEGPFRVGIIGRLVPHKGLALVLETARHVQAEKLPLRFVVIGPTADGEALRKANVTILGDYDEDELRSLLWSSKVEALWFTSMVPESFSYTLTAGLASGLPLVVPDIGAFPERVKGHGGAWVTPFDAPAKEFAKLLCEVREACGRTWELRPAEFGIPAHAKTSAYPYYPFQEQPTGSAIVWRPTGIQESRHLDGGALMRPPGRRR